MRRNLLNNFDQCACSFDKESDMSYTNCQAHCILKSSGALIARFPCAIIRLVDKCRKVVLHCVSKNL